MELKCHNPECKWTWNYKGKKNYPAWVTCPNCFRRVRLPKNDSQEWKVKIGLLNMEDSTNYLKRRLHDGWAMILGDLGAITFIEEQVYPPSTKENKNFEMIGFPRPIFVAKKTNALKQILNDIDDFDTVLVLTCHAIDKNNTIHTELVHSTPETLDNSIDNVVKQAIAIQSSSMLE